MTLFSRYFLATRPWSFVMSLVSVTVGTLLALREGPVSWGWFACVAVGITAFHAAANVFNDYFDTRNAVDTPECPTAKYRPHPIFAGLLSSRQLLAYGIVLLAIPAAVGFSAAWFRSAHVLWIGALGLLACVFYTAGPMSLKYRALGEPAVFAMWGPLMVEGAYAVQRQVLSLEAALVSVPFGLLVALVLFANNMRDREDDACRHVKTLSILLGRRGSYRFFVGLIASAYAFVLALVASGTLSLWGLLIFLSVPKALSLVKTFREDIPDMADALTAQFDTIFGLLLLAAIAMGSTGLL